MDILLMYEQISYLKIYFIIIIQNKSKQTSRQARISFPNYLSQFRSQFNISKHSLPKQVIDVRFK